ncbi:MAG: hypothetical protein ACTTKL_00320 [Treponema sp.]
MSVKLHKKIVGAAAAALFGLSMFFSIIYIAHELNHDCCHGHCRAHHDEECPVCALLQVSAAVMLGFSLAAVFVVRAQFLKPLKSVSYVRAFFAHDTLISWKTKLST